MSSGEIKQPTFFVTLLSGASAGLAVDLTLFPLDTIKTRLQSPKGIGKGGFTKIYAGIGSVIIGSAPSSAVFFVTYEMFKSYCVSRSFTQYPSLNHMLGASISEVASCIIRVPLEVVKSRTQAKFHSTSLQVFKHTIQTEGFYGLYRGYLSTIIREIPFSFIQFPIWEKLKSSWHSYQNFPVVPWQSSMCGAIAGSIAAAVTTPLDVAKTRIMLAEKGTLAARGNMFHVIKDVYVEKGITGLFSGIVPRVLWISLGGAIFFFAYEKTRFVLLPVQNGSS